jgi:nitrous oxidase accessory protein
VKRSASILVLLLFSSAVLVSLPQVEVAKAETKTIVVPDDYPTIASAIGNATDGDTVFVKKGTYDGPINQTLVINKTISLIGEDPETTILNLHPPWIPQTILNPYEGYADSIEIRTKDVELSGFTISGKGKLITERCSKVQIKNNNLKLRLFLYGSYENIFQNNLTGGISVYSAHATVASNNFIRCSLVIGTTANPYCTAYDNVVTNSTGLVSGGNGNVIFNNTVTNCTYGLLIGTYARNNIAYENILTNNDVGIRVQSGKSNNTLYGNYVANNRYGAFVIGGKESVVLYYNDFVDNIEQVNTDSVVVWADGREEKAYHGGIFDNGEEGNYWSDYTGADADGDGIGDTPYVIDENRTDNYPLMQPVIIPRFQPPDTTSPNIYVGSPQNKTYTTDSVSLIFAVNEETSWMGYSLDGQTQVTTTEKTLNITGLTNGLHTLTVYANDTSGNTVASETVTFTINKEADSDQNSNPDSSPITWTSIAIVVITAVVVATILIYYARKRKQKH